MQVCWFCLLTGLSRSCLRSSLWGPGPITGVLTQDSSNPDIQTGRKVSATHKSTVDSVIEDENGNEIGPFTNKILNTRLEKSREQEK